MMGLPFSHNKTPPAKPGEFYNSIDYSAEII